MAESEGRAESKSKARSRWRNSILGTKNIVRQKKVVEDVTSAVAAETAEWPFYLTVQNGGGKIYSIADMVDQFVHDDDMEQLENRCVCTLDVDDDILDVTKTMEDSTAGAVFEAHAQVLEFLKARRAASARRDLDVGLANRRTSLARAEEERDRQREQVDAREEDDMDNEPAALPWEEEVDAQTSGRSGKAPISSRRTHSMGSTSGSNSATARSTGARPTLAAAQQPQIARRGSGGVSAVGPLRVSPPNVAGTRGAGSTADATPGAATPTSPVSLGGASSADARRRSLGLIRAGNAMATPRGREPAALREGRQKDPATGG